MKQTAKKPVREDWHPADIKAALEKRGHTLTSLAAECGYGRGFCNNAFRQKSPNAERVIAAALDKKPWDIWPSRYDSDNQPIMRRPLIRNSRPKKQTESTCKTGSKDTALAENLNGNVAAG
jgi:Ner family transcriptional regulator